MSLKVKYFNEKSAEEALKECPQIVQDYVEKLKISADSWRSISDGAVNKLRSISKHNAETSLAVKELKYYEKEKELH